MSSPVNPASAIDIDVWTEKTIQSLSTLAISSAITPHGPRGTSVTLDIPLDTHHEPKQEDPNKDPSLTAGAAIRAGYVRSRREPLRRDSMKRREALLKGKEGSRRRQKWENDRLLGNPWAEPPTSKDWEVPVPRPKRVQYSLASHWDEPRARAEREKMQQHRSKVMQAQDPFAQVPRELREKLRRARGAKGLLKDLEEQIREFVQKWDESQRQLEQDGFADVDTSEDEEIVFVGRNGQKTKEARAPDSPRSRAIKERMIFDSLADDQGASFGRWLVHSIATYYDLHTFSLTTGSPARREAYVAINEGSPRLRRSLEAEAIQLPRPLYVLV